MGLTDGRKDGTDGEVVGGGFIGFRQLLWIVRGYSQPAIGPNDPPSRLGRQIILPYMESIEASDQTEVGAVVHDEPDACSEARPEFTRIIEHLAGVAGLVAVLQQRTARGSKFLGRSERSGNIGKTRSVENRVESRKVQHRLNFRDATCRVFGRESFCSAASRVSTIVFLSSPGISQ